MTRYPPDLAIEILSPGTSRNDRGRKLRLFERHRVRESWLVDPESAAIEVYRLEGERCVLAGTAHGDELITSALLAALELRPSDVVPASAH